MKNLSLILALGSALFLFIWIGLQIKPKPFYTPALPIFNRESIALPTDLPFPVERYLTAVYGEQIPTVETVVITGRGRIRPFGIWMPTRFIIVHETGRNYRHYFETTFFGVPFLKIDEGILDGASFFESPMGSYHNDRNTNQAANLALWAEGGWFPAMWATNPNARWIEVDENTAILRVPFGEESERLIARFDPRTGSLTMMEAMRYRNPGDEEKILWITSTSEEGRVAYATWLDQGKPWAELVLEEISYNLDVKEYIRKRGK